MSVNLQKGQKISLVKPGEPGLKRIMVGRGWDEGEQKRGDVYKRQGFHCRCGRRCASSPSPDCRAGPR